MKRSTRRVLTVLLGVTALILSGCVRQEIKATVSASGKVSGVVSFGIDARAIKELGASPQQVAAEAKADLKKAKLPKGVTAKVTTTKAYITTAYTLKSVTPEAFSLIVLNGSDIVEGRDSTQVLTTDGAAWTFLLVAKDGTESSGPSETPEADQAVRDAFSKYPPKIKISMTFPGAVTEADPQAQTSGKTATWSFSPEIDAEFELKAVANAK